MADKQRYKETRSKEIRKRGKLKVKTESPKPKLKT
jgi:hypothetical protein